MATIPPVVQRAFEAHECGGSQHDIHRAESVRDRRRAKTVIRYECDHCGHEEVASYTRHASYWVGD